jgi:predicted  nucleic acid-binding Zn-ribbon protein
MTTDTTKDTTKAPATEKTDKPVVAKTTKTSSKPAPKAAPKVDEPKAVEEKTDVKESAKTTAKDDAEVTEKADIKATEKADAKTPKLPTIKIKNSGPYNVLETATGVLLKAKQTTTVNIPAHVDKDQVVRNIKQMNITRGKTLQIIS